MKLAAAAICAILLCFFSMITLGAEPSFGQREYQVRCAMCHGNSGRGDGWLADNIQTISQLAPQVARYRETARETGRKAEVAILRKIGIGTTREQVEQEWLPGIVDELRKYVADGVAFQDPAVQQKLVSGAKLRLSDLPPDQFIAGSPEDCIAALRDCHARTGCEYVVADFGRAAHGEPYTKINGAFQLFGKEVMPEFR